MIRNSLRFNTAQTPLVPEIPLDIYQTGPSGVVGPIILVIIVVALNVLLIAFALRLRRRIRQIAGDDEE